MRDGRAAFQRFLVVCAYLFVRRYSAYNVLTIGPPGSGKMMPEVIDFSLIAGVFIL
jgi:hypothetical protein